MGRLAIVVGGLVLLGVGLCTSAGAASDQTYSGDFFTRSTLTGDWGGARNDLATKGVAFDASLTQIEQGVVSGGKNGSREYGGRGNLTGNLDTQKLGLWPGGFLTAELEGNWSDSVNGKTGALTIDTLSGSAWSLMRPTNTDDKRIVERPHAHLNPAPTLQLAQAAGREPEKATATAAGPEEKEQSATEINKQLSNPVTSFWSLTFQFNNYDLENGHWNHNMQFQPVLPVSLTEEWNLINRPVIPVYNSVPYPTGLGRFRQTTAFGDLADVELLSPAHSGGWLLGLGPTFIFPTGSTYTGQDKYQIGPAAVVGYLTKHHIVGIFPQQWWSVSGGKRPPVSQLNVQPFWAYFLPDGWSVGYSGNILANERASTGQMWTVPIGLSVAKVQFLGKLPVKFALAGQYMPVHPSDFGQEWNVQLVITPVIPKLLKGTIF